MQQINIWVVLLSVAMNFAISIVLHMFVFKNIKTGTSKKKMPKEAVPVALIGTIMMNYALAYVLKLADVSTAKSGAIGGALLWLGFLAPLQIAVKYTNDQPWKIYLANTFCTLAAFVILGAFLAVYA